MSRYQAYAQRNHFKHRTPFNGRPKNHEETSKDSWSSRASSETSYKNSEGNIYYSDESRNNSQRQEHQQPFQERKQVNEVITESNFDKSQNQEAPIEEKDALISSVKSQAGQNQHLRLISQNFLQEIQNLRYQELIYEELEPAFKEIVAGHISFKGIHPQADSTIGSLLVSNGIFHEMWGKVMIKSKEKHDFCLYYQKFEKQIKQNHSNFESTFNQCNSISVDFQQEQRVSFNGNFTNNEKSYRSKGSQFNFYLPIREQNQQGNNSKQSQQGLNFSKKENIAPLPNKNIQADQNGRVRLFGQIQTNQRRLNAQIVCFFLNIKLVYKLESVHISKILQARFSAKSQIVVLEGQVQSFSNQLQKMVLDYRPKLLLIAYGDVNFGTLLRLQGTYGSIQGLVVYDELIEIKRWLKANSLLEEAQL